MVSLREQIRKGAKHLGSATKVFAGTWLPAKRRPTLIADEAKIVSEARYGGK